MTGAVLTFLGAAGTVTGSKFLYEEEGQRYLADCGMFQGEAVWRRRNWDDFPIAPDTLRAVVLTHAHLDHCGYLPALVRQGFRGPVICSESTAAVAAIVLRDAAHLQEEDAVHARAGGYSRHDPPLPLFDTADAERAIALFRPAATDERTHLPAGATVSLHRAGHILGSTFAVLERHGHRLLISGDLGRQTHPLLLPPVAPPAVDTIVIESTYGNRKHAPLDRERLGRLITATAHRDGVTLIPAFAVDRTAIVLHTLAGLARDGLIPRMPVYVDSPMAPAALDVYRIAIEEKSPELRADLISDGDPFDPGDLRLVHSAEESQRINNPGHPCIIVSASGMATGGRVLHHLRHQLPDPRNTVLLTGFQVPGTRGRSLLDGARSVKIHGRYVPVRAHVLDLPEFSAHADSDELISWLASAPEPPETVYVVHGEPDARQTLVERISIELDWLAVAPQHLERVRLW
ncbi:metallo-beta-lactamase family protein [Kribbella orskensis]|uniref:Metallo-beta-lactamase family protein n=1 Tax=Kribbella orskensis TaxID=2512216 RepID=A0ABY2B8L2_9ACTN|nr:MULTISPECIES: MBL fold metallo-hydrolase [Kribbella]TCN31209.1 metallo-beta-lactamase family protein [Kribbella sp. VKM Ac-2500]TCO11715.1 metallo-beta-lactamase family protein [Kribbella orskensis]